MSPSVSCLVCHVMVYLFCYCTFADDDDGDEEDDSKKDHGDKTEKKSK